MARLSPIGAPDLPFAVTRAARRVGGWSALPKVNLSRSVSDLIDEERDDHR